ADVRALLGDERIGFTEVGSTSHARGSLQAMVMRAANPGGPFGLKRVIDDVARTTDMLCQELPDVLSASGVDAIVTDQMEAAGGLVAEGLQIPFVSVACALPVNREPDIPLPVMPWGYASDARGRQLNEGSTGVYDWLMRPHERVIARHAERFGLGSRRRLDDCLSPLAQISQTTPAFDFPRRSPPPHFHAVGPLRAPAQRESPFEWAPDPARPFAFASLGTLQGGRFGLFRRIARACAAEGVQVLIAHCNLLTARQADALLDDGAFAVTGFAPQRAALARADIVFTHGGLNTVMDALAAGKPMLTLPIAFDQPGVAARVVHAGCGLRLLPALATVGSLRRALRRLLDEPGFTARSRELGAQVATSGGAALAADITEAATGLAAPVVHRPAISRERAALPASATGWSHAA
ncbi:MAG: glycosyltransferase, partial [Haliea sp.]